MLHPTSWPLLGRLAPAVVAGLAAATVVSGCTSITGGSEKAAEGCADRIASEFGRTVSVGEGTETDDGSWQFTVNVDGTRVTCIAGSDGQVRSTMQE